MENEQNVICGYCGNKITGEETGGLIIPDNNGETLENIKICKACLKRFQLKIALSNCEVMNVDTKLFSKELEKLPEDERKRALEDARQSAKEQQERLTIVQHQQWEKERNIKHGNCF